MKILNVITSLQRAAGTSVFCGEVANGLVACGHDVTVAVVNPRCENRYSLDSRVRLVSLAWLLSDSGSKPRVPGVGCKSGYDIVHIHALWSPILHRASKWARQNKIPLVWSPHGMLTPWAMNNKRVKKLLGWWLYQKWDLAKADLLHATADSEVADIRRMGLENEVVVVPLGARIEPLKVRRSARKEGRVLLFVSRVQKKKGLINLVQAWARLPTEVRARWKVRIVGPDEDDHEAEVRAECGRLGVVEEWEFAGPKYGDDLRQEYENADLFALPSHSENFGSVVVEALANGVPVITTKGTPWRELEVCKCGWCIDIGVKPLTTSLMAAMKLSDDERLEMGLRGRRLVEEKYCWNAVVGEILESYKKVCDEKIQSIL